MEERPIAFPNSWKTLPFPPQIESLPFERVYSAEEFALITRGSIPESMDDHWFIYYHEGSVYFHRSWTGLLIYRIDLEQQGETYIVREAIVNRDPEQYKSTDAIKDIELLEELVDYDLLN